MSSDSASAGMRLDLDPVHVVADSPLMRSIDRASLEGLRAELESIVLDEQAHLVLNGTGGGALYFVAARPPGDHSNPDGRERLGR